MVENGYVVYGGRSFVNLIYESSELAVPEGVIPLMQIPIGHLKPRINPIRFVLLSDDVIYTFVERGEALYRKGVRILRTLI